MQHVLTQPQFSMQQIQLVGNLGADCEVVEFNGAKFVTFRLACTEKFRKGDEVREETTWYSCSYNRADSGVVPFLKRGQSVFVQGKPSYLIYDSAKYRQKMIDVRVFVDMVQLVGNRSDAGQHKPDNPNDLTQDETVPVY